MLIHWDWVVTGLVLIVAWRILDFVLGMARGSKTP
jgi:hypothetical protein